MSYCSDIEATHQKAQGFSDRFALRITKTLRWGADTFLPSATAIVPSFWRPSRVYRAWLAQRFRICAPFG